MTREELDQLLEERDQQAIVLDDFDDAIEGYTAVADGIRVVYNYEKCIQCLVAEGMTEEEAVDCFDYNTMRSLPYMGVLHPLILFKS